MHQDIMDALNLAGRRRGYDDGGMVADEMMSDDPTQQFMANLARAGFTQDQINSIIGSQSPQTNQMPSQGAPMPPQGAKPIGGQPGNPRYYPGGSPKFPPPIDGDPVNLGGPMGGNYGPGIDPYMGQPITEYANPFGGPNYGPPPGGMGGTGTKAGVGANANGTIPRYNGPPTYNPGNDYGGGMDTGLPFPYGAPGTNLGGNQFPGGYQSPYNPFLGGGGAGHKGGSGTKGGPSSGGGYGGGYGGMF